MERLERGKALHTDDKKWLDIVEHHSINSQGTNDLLQSLSQSDIST